MLDIDEVRATVRSIRQNLFFALICNASGVPVAAGALYPLFGILIGPMFAAFATSASSISVVLNALACVARESEREEK